MISTKIYDVLVQECAAEFQVDDDVVKAIIAAELEPLETHVAELQHELAAIRFAARMPATYEHGLPAWINHLYAYFIGAEISPHVTEQIESGRLTFPNSPHELRLALFEQLAKRIADMYGNTSWNVGAIRDLIFAVKNPNLGIKIQDGENDHSN